MDAVTSIRATLFFFVAVFVACITLLLATDSTFLRLPSLSEAVPPLGDYSWFASPRPSAYVVLKQTTIYRDEQLQNPFGVDLKNFVVCVISIKEMTAQNRTTKQMVAYIKSGKDNAWVRADDLAPTRDSRDVCDGSN